MAGHESTASALTWVMHQLGTNPEVFKKVRQEADELYSNDEVEYDMLNKLKYTDAVIKETLRLLPPGTVVGRTTTAEAEILGYKVPQGVRISKLCVF